MFETMKALIQAALVELKPAMTEARFSIMHTVVQRTGALPELHA